MKNPVSMILATLGTIFMLAMAFAIIPAKLAIFAGVTCYVLAALVKNLLK